MCTQIHKHRMCTYIILYRNATSLPLPALFSHARAHADQICAGEIGRFRARNDSDGPTSRSSGGIRMTRTTRKAGRGPGTHIRVTV